ncbi:MAG: hypothetical protein ACT4OI_08955 [Methanobacteriota archaeon]
MRSARLALLAYLAASLVLWSLVPPGFAQGVTGELIVQTDFELIGTSELNGGGHVTWILTGDEAGDLRRKIVAMFDEYSQIPAGFPVEGTTTSRSQNGLIDLGEAGAYTARLENNIEGFPPGSPGLDAGYFRLIASDLLFQGSIETSTTGLVGTDPSDTSNLEIRFFFNGRTTTQDAVLPLPTRAFADALHDVFSFRRAQASNLTGSPWPLLAEDGWNVVTVGNVTALWAGDIATGRYVNGASNATRTAELVASAVPALDLRFATTAYADVTYRGRVADPNDVLRFEVARDAPTFSTWTEVGRLSATSGAWRTERIDLNLFLGQRARFRFHFTSDGTGVDEGFFLRDFAIVAPSTYEGVIVESQAHYLIGTLSFADPAVPVGGLNVVRTPGGEIAWYGATWATAAPPPDTVRFQTFNALENPQALFVLMIVATYTISRSQEVAWDRFRDAHAAPMRAGLERTRWLHITGKAVMAALILLYFLPTAFVNLGLRVFVSGPAYWLLAVTLAIALALGTRLAYQVRLERAAPLGVTKEGIAAPAAKQAEGHCTHCLREIGREDRTYECACGAGYHLTCASGLERCTKCRRSMALEVVS